MSERADFTLTLPAPPSANALFTHRAGSRQRIKTNAYRAWIEEAGWALKFAQDDRALPLKHVRMEYRLPFNYRRDIMNGVKAIEDLLVAHGVLVDDRWVEKACVERVPVGQPLTVSIWRLE